MFDGFLSASTSNIFKAKIVLSTLKIITHAFFPLYFFLFIKKSLLF
jgi:hypothetical protein